MGCQFWKSLIALCNGSEPPPRIITDPNTFMKYYLAGIWLGFIYPGTAYKPT